jgi:hypothetical protein
MHFNRACDLLRLRNVQDLVLGTEILQFISRQPENSLLIVNYFSLVPDRDVRRRLSITPFRGRDNLFLDIPSDFGSSATRDKRSPQGYDSTFGSEDANL